ncbi:hypothetical protein ElyMa_006270100 [Elysia marginata]|uniref:MADF domain-containing protein n=1 Tax=Elysia marginata TaxID=1093978 RepID=A0AAV4HC33_9GAST|nr:hypothetical protein ElyMa_006270100 [Elysia marginata]
MEDAGIIELVRARPALFNKRDKNYTNRDFVQRMWEQVASEFNEKEFFCFGKRMACTEPVCTSSNTEIILAAAVVVDVVVIVVVVVY